MSEPNPDLVEASGHGAEVFDAPTLFYLTHQTSIETWHALQRPTRRVVDRYLMTLAEPLEEIALEFGGHLEILDDGGRYPLLSLLASDGMTPGLAKPAMLIGVEWDRNQVRIDDGANAPIVGVRIGSKHHDGLRQKFLDAGDPSARHVRKREGYDRSSWWPALTRCVGPANWWADLDGYRDLLMTTVRKLVNDFKPALDETVPR